MLKSYVILFWVHGMRIKVMENGPLVFEFDDSTELELENGEKFTDLKTLTICRCGQSDNQPFCDDSCNEKNFLAKGGEIELIWGQVETKEINIKTDGPIKIPLRGRYIYKKDLEKEERTEKKMALCRCGKSETKPFCDGTHKKIKFESIGGKIKIR